LSKFNTGKLRQFVATVAVSSDGAGKGILTIDPPIYSAVDAKQNVNASPADGAALTFVTGAANSITPQSIAFHSDAFMFACVDLEDVSQYGAWGTRISDKQLGMSMRIARQYAIGTDAVPCRIDVLYGWLLARAQMAVRIQGSNT
jgi:hypothetical protein